jgi:hypothetical protein
VPISEVLPELPDPFPNLLALFFAGIFLFVFVEQDQQMNVLSFLEIQIQIAVTTALSFTPVGICYARFAHASQAGNYRAAIRILLKITLDRFQAPRPHSHRQADEACA